MDKIIEIKEEVQIGNIILEKGDKIRVLTEDFGLILTDDFESLKKTLNTLKVNDLISIKGYTDTSPYLMRITFPLQLATQRSYLIGVESNKTSNNPSTRSGSLSFDMNDNEIVYQRTLAQRIQNVEIVKVKNKEFHFSPYNY